ncbi:MAG: sigma-54 dependent transcriptional regulator [Thermodesulfobacteriota bacterium]
MMEKPKILLVDDNQTFVELFLCLPEAEAYDLFPFTSARAALDFFKKGSVDLVISDVQMPDMDGNELLAAIQDINPDIPFILMTAYGSTEKAVTAIRHGAYHYFQKPLDDQWDLFWATVREALEKRRRLKEIESLRTEKTLKVSAARSMIDRTPGMQQVLQAVNEVAGLPVTVLIYGETGTGKELVARAIHELSDRKARGFFAVNCNEFSPGVLESELFGHEKGAFTGAVGFKKGLFEIADKGTLFLDEISNASSALQSKLLRVLETHDFTRVGGNVTLSSDFRVLAATNIRLEELVGKGEFRQDLLYRLNVYTIEIPPLRKRKSDIPLLAEFYMERFRKAYNRPVRRISEQALAALGVYDWPGNVRELVNVIERAVITCRESMITTAHLPLINREMFHSSSLDLKEMEKYLIGLALKKERYNKTRAAAHLGISRKTLIEKVKKYEIEDRKNDEEGSVETE